MSHDQLTALKTEAGNFGLEPTEIADVLDKWGPTVLSIIVDGLKHGFSWTFLGEVLEKLGALFLQATVATFGVITDGAKFSAAKPCGTQVCGGCEGTCNVGAVPIISGEQVDSFGPVVNPGANPLADLLAKYLPQLLQQYGPQLMQWIVQLITEALQNKTKQAELVALFNKQI